MHVADMGQQIAHPPRRAAGHRGVEVGPPGGGHEQPAFVVESVDVFVDFHCGSVRAPGRASGPAQEPVRGRQARFRWPSRAR
jgi:hypothetical protein